MRECGECTLCCTLLGVKELKKPPLLTCQHVVPLCGCGIYENRPASCRDFACVWLSSDFAPAALRPDRIRGVMVATPDGNIVLHEDPAYPGLALGAMKPLLDRFVADGHAYYVVLTGQRRLRTFFGDRALLPEAMAMLDEVDSGEIG